MSKGFGQIEGFQKLQDKLMKLSDAPKKQEVLRLLRVVAKPTVQAVKGAVPIQRSRSNIKSKRTVLGGSLKQSIGTITGKKGSSRINPTIYVGPRVFKGKKADKSGRNTYGDGWYGHMVDQGHDIYRNSQLRGKVSKKGRKLSVLGRLRTKNKGKTVGRVEGRFFMKKGFSQTQGQVTKEAESAVAKYMQKQIDRLSR